MKRWSIALGLLTLSVAVGGMMFGHEGPESTSYGTLEGQVTEAVTKHPLPGVRVVVTAFGKEATTGQDGRFRITELPPGTYEVKATLVGYRPQVEAVRIRAGRSTEQDFVLVPEATELQDVVGHKEEEVRAWHGRIMPEAALRLDASRTSGEPVQAPAGYLPSDFNTEAYDYIAENTFMTASDHPLSTFSIDVDAASYSNLRRFLQEGRLPPKDAVRIEEMVNYFTYDYPEPDGDRPFSVTTEVGRAPWNPDRLLVHVGLQGKRIPESERPASNLVFLIDVSGSMDYPNKLPLLKQAFRMLVDVLRPEDRVAIVVYAGAAGLVLPSTPGDQKEVILDAIERLSAGGTTAGAAGIRLAYETAREHFIDGGNNRVILATDGDFNVGVSSDGELVRLIEVYREQGTFLTVLGFGTGNLKDAKMEKLADHGNGNYYYIDGALEAKKVLVSELGSTLFTIAKDVKVQVEFNPAHVKAYRLIGYENRLLADEDFNDDTKDAGELGAGHTVTALYEVIPVGVDADGVVRDRGDLKYQQNRLTDAAHGSDELMTVKLRYKAPDGHTSRLIENVVNVPESDEDAVSEDFTFSAAVAAFGMLLRDSEYKGTTTVDQVLSLAREGRGPDEEGYRAEFIRLVEMYGQIVQARDEQTAARP